MFTKADVNCWKVLYLGLFRLFWWPTKTDKIMCTFQKSRWKKRIWNCFWVSS